MRRRESTRGLSLDLTELREMSRRDFMILFDWLLVSTYILCNQCAALLSNVGFPSLFKAPLSADWFD